MTNEQIKNIAAKFNISLEDAAKVHQGVKVDVLELLEDELYETIYNYYCESGEMSYEEASRGDPYAWIAEQLQKEFNIYA